MLGQKMEREIREQPEVLRSNATRYFEEAPRPTVRPQMVLLAARGSSDNAALYARYLIEIHLGIPVSLAAPSVITRFKAHLAYPPCLAIGISQSGAAPDVAEVLAAMRAQGHQTLAITNTSGSRLTAEAEHTVLLDAGAETSIAATKTYSASLLALYQVVRALGADLPDPTASLPDDAWIQAAEEAALALNGPIVRCSPTFALGRGYGFCTAEETALKLMECALIPCKSYSSADFQHGPKALAGHGSAAISYEGTLPDLAAQGCEIITAPRPDGVPAELRPIWEIAFGQWTALTAARARGLEPDSARHLSKVTQTR